MSNFVPRRRLISAFTLAENGAVTTTENHDYESGLDVRVFVPREYGMDIDHVQTQITVTSNTEFTTDINTVFQAPFVAPNFPPAFTDAQTVPMSGATDNIAG